MDRGASRLLCQCAVALLLIFLPALCAIAQPAPPSISCNTPLPSAPPEGNLKFVVKIEADKTWQPQRGEVKFIIEGQGVADNKNIVTCFRWRRKNAAVASQWVQSSSLKVIESNPTMITFAATVPAEIPGHEKWWQRLPFLGDIERYDSWSTVLVADFRILTASAETILTDNVLSLGITSVAFSLALAAMFIMIALGLLYYFGVNSGVPGEGIMLKIISTRTGYASVSQFQIVLWTVVVGAGAIYVMSLSGNLIDISTGTLILLGITGIATLGSKLKGGQDTSAAPTALPALSGAIDGIVTKAFEAEVRLSWRAPTTGGPPMTYTVQYRVSANPVNNWKIATYTITRPSFTVIGLAPGTPYDFQVAAWNSAGSGPPTPASETTAAAPMIPTGAPGQVSNLTANPSPIGSTVELRWGQPSPAATGYLIEYRIHDSGELWENARSTQNNATLTLFPNTVYDVRVRGSNDAGSGPTSPVLSVTTGLRTPAWSDLVMPNDQKREIDVTRVQMLFFTVITAIFVGLKVLSSGEIPDIPQGFLLLMGISNGVYLTAKFLPD